MEAKRAIYHVTTQILKFEIVRLLSIDVVAVGHLHSPIKSHTVTVCVCERLDTRKMWAYFFISLSMRPA